MGVTEHVAPDALDEIALHRPLGELLRHHYTKPGRVGLTRAVVESEVTPANDTPKSKNG